MKKYHVIMFSLFIAMLLICTVAVVGFNIKDMTVAQGQVEDFNYGWRLERPNGSSINIASLPYSEPSKAEDVYYLIKDIDSSVAGKTLRFLSADKNLSVSINGEEIYEFGYSDERLFGNTPGSITNFVDIPADIDEGQIKIKMQSPYDGYAATICAMVIGDKDVVELYLIKDNLFNFFVCMLIMFCALMLIILDVIVIFSRQKFTGTCYLGMICFLGAIYHAIETKTLNVFFGNQTLYSILVFVIIMMLPTFLCLYYICSLEGKYQRRFKVNFFICTVNILFQYIIQISNTADFMSIAFLSHIIIAVTVINVDLAIIQMILETKKAEGKLDISRVFEAVGVTSIMVGSLIDIVRFYVSPVGDMGRYGRLGMMVFSIITLAIHIRMITDRYLKQVEENINLMQEHLQEAEESNKAKSMFLANMSHEIRTPMNSIMGFSEILLNQDMSEEQKDYVENIRESSYNLLKIINDILDISKIESGKMEIVEEEFDTKDILKGVCNEIKSLAAKKNLEFKIKIDKEIPTRLYGDQLRIREILVNVLNNAVKYTEEGNVSFIVYNGYKEFDVLHLGIRVSDTGIGIGGEDKSYIFNVFEQADSKNHRMIEGTGLGLSIVKKYIELMNGTIEVESELGKGSTFTISLPLKIVDNEPMGEIKFERVKGTKSNISNIKIDKKILVVDDSLVNLKVITRALEHYGVKVDAVNSGQKAIDSCKDAMYDVVLMDQMMPVMDGVEAMKLIREIPGYEKGSANKIYALTANAIKGVEEELLAEGFDAYLKKPIEFDKLEKLLLQ